MAAKPPPLSRLLSDLVLDSKLETVDLGTCVQHTFLRPGRSAGERYVRVEERWARETTLGEGAHGTVYREKLEGQAALRAVKEIKKSVCAELDYSRELEAIIKFSHPKYAHCFVTSNGWFELGDSILISMEYLALGDLEAHIAHPLAEIEARQISSQVLEGLGYMHENGFVHRDLKPKNIMVVSKTPEWFVKISDFGVSKRRLPDATLQYTSKWLSVNYAAPEQLGLGVDASTAQKSPFAMDIWSLGAVAYRVLTNSVPFQLGDLVAYVHGSPDKFPASRLQSFRVSELGINFTATVMSPLPASRPSAPAALEHPWFHTMLAPSSERQGPSTQAASSGSVKNDTQVSDASAVWSTVSFEGVVDKTLIHASAKKTIPFAVPLQEDLPTHVDGLTGIPQVEQAQGGNAAQAAWSAVDGSGDPALESPPTSASETQRAGMAGPATNRPALPSHQSDLPEPNSHHQSSAATNSRTQNSPQLVPENCTYSSNQLSLFQSEHPSSNPRRKERQIYAPALPYSAPQRGGSSRDPRALS